MKVKRTITSRKCSGTFANDNGTLMKVQMRQASSLYLLLTKI